MSHLARLAQRALGVEGGLRPAIDRWHIERAPQVFADAATYTEANTATPRETWDRILGPTSAKALPSSEVPRSVERPAKRTIRAQAPQLGRRSAPALPIALEGRKASAGVPPEEDTRRSVPLPTLGPAAGRAARTPTVTQAFEERTHRLRQQARLLPPKVPTAKPELSSRKTQPQRAGVLHSSDSGPSGNEPGPVYVHIGRIDVRAIDATTAKAPPAARSAIRRPTLEAHLRLRDGDMR